MHSDRSDDVDDWADDSDVDFDDYGLFAVEGVAVLGASLPG